MMYEGRVLVDGHGATWAEVSEDQYLLVGGVGAPWSREDIEFMFGPARPEHSTFTHPKED